MKTIVPHIWCDRNAVEAAEFYARLFPRTTWSIDSRYPHEGLLDFQKEFAGLPLTVGLSIDGFPMVLINAGSEFRPNLSISFMLNFDPLFFDDDAVAARGALDALWEGLTDGGVVRMEKGEYPFSAHYGWVEDRYGVNWQLMLTNPAGDPRPFICPALMFGGPAQNMCELAVSHYLDVFPNSGWGNRVTYPAPTGPATEASLMFSDFTLAGQWFVAMDSGVEQEESFTCGVSFEVSCADQAEIDHFWEALSAQPEAEQCGWLADQAGVSWQIVPQNMGELMERPHAFDTMLRMKKIVIADF